MTYQNLHRPDRTILFDGGMGTELLRREIISDELPEICNLEYPGHVLDIHRLYVEAGAQVIQTNTFGANRYRLAEATDGLTVKEIVSAAVSLAKEASQERALIAGTVGPLGRRLEPHGPVNVEDARRAFAEVMEHLLFADIDVIVIETMTTLDEASIAVRQALIAGASTVAVTLAFEDRSEGPRTSCGTSPGEAVLRLQDTGANIVGCNCGSGLVATKEIAREMIHAAELPVLVQATAGLPDTSQRVARYPVQPCEFALFARELIDMRVRLIGGCCGTTPEHIREIAKILR